MAKNTRVPPDQYLQRDIQTLLNDIQQLKQYQLSGEDSIRMQRIFSEDAYDWSKVNVMFDDTAFNLVFTPESTDFDTSLVYKMEYTYTESGSGSSVQIDVERQKVEAGNVQKWLFVVTGSDFFPNALVTIKFYFWASVNQVSEYVCSILLDVGNV